MHWCRKKLSCNIHRMCKPILLNRPQSLTNPISCFYWRPHTCSNDARIIQCGPITLKWRQTTCSASLHITAAWHLTAKLLRQSMLTVDDSTVGYKVQWNINQNINMQKDENEIGNIICKMATISFRPQHINERDADDISSRFFVTCIFITWHPRR